ncbi:hypothetical protein, partial [Bowdeniella massiliensis]|uniref:hypothetical protein n=1 Tax=Bowdeniella massiliensis TaxID=2932264 RepID=UPI0020279435
MLDGGAAARGRADAHVGGASDAAVPGVLQRLGAGGEAVGARGGVGGERRRQRPAGATARGGARPLAGAAAAP